MFLPPEKIPRGAKNSLDNCSTHGRNIFPFAETASPGLGQRYLSCKCQHWMLDFVNASMGNANCPYLSTGCSSTLNMLRKEIFSILSLLFSTVLFPSFLFYSILSYSILFYFILFYSILF
jgi:hypothetical protein